MKKEAIYQGKDYQIVFEVNHWAERADVSLRVQSKETVIFTTAILGEEHPELDFAPLTIEYDERYYAVGKIYGSRFIRRETRPSNIAILNARMIDRALRSALPGNFRRSVQIINTVLSYDRQVEPVILALLGSSLALHLLGIDWQGPVGAVKVSYCQDRFRINPSEEEEASSLFNLVVSNVKDKVNMIEFAGQEVKEDLILQGIQIALSEARKLSEFLAKNFTPEKIANASLDLDSYQKAFQRFQQKYNLDLEQALFTYQEGEKNYQDISQLILQEAEPEAVPYLMQVFRNELKKIFTKTVLQKKIRPDGRKFDEIRPLFAEVGFLPKAHGSALFFRGLTHVLSTVTLAPPGEELWIKTVEFEGFKRFMHHYNFPPYATGEISAIRGPSRREIGHGALAEKAIASLLPTEEIFPYTIRTVSDILSSNGSTSMGSVTATSLALMDAGVPIKRHVAGISIGIAYQDENNYALLTDIQGPEDFFGGMDFKIAGTKEGITAIQLDVKIDGLSLKMIAEVFQKAKTAIERIIAFQNKIISEPRGQLKEDVPRVKVFKINPEKIGLLIGAGGKTINAISSATDTKIDIKPDGTVYISGETENQVAKASDWAKIITEELSVGDMITGKVVKIRPFGAILEIFPGKTALLHISEIADHKIKNIEDEVKIGEEYSVKIKEILPDGRIYVSLKDAKQ